MSRSSGLLLALIADELWGDTARWHPVAGFGTIAARLEERLYADSRAAGMAHTVVLVLPPVLLAAALERRLGARGRVILLGAVGWTALGGRTLRRTGAEMAALLEAGDLPGARALAPSLMGRRPDDLDAGELARATIESLAENTADAVGATLVWGALLGSAGVVLHRAANTLDAMVGHRNARYQRFGWSAARLDDALGLPGARVTAAAAVLAAPLCGAPASQAFRVWRRDARAHPSPNAGHIEAAFAGALGVTLGGANDYDGIVEQRDRIGDGPRPGAEAIRRAIRLSAVTQFVLSVATAVWRCR